MTQAAAPASLTRRMTLFATVHVPLVHPLMAAKCMTTVDRASHGRAALNIVAGFLDRLAAYGVRPEDVTMVIKTHLHVDHVGWNTRLVDGHWVLTFPNARYLIGRDELAHWTRRAGHR